MGTRRVAFCRRVWIGRTTIDGFNKIPVGVQALYLQSTYPQWGAFPSYRHWACELYIHLHWVVLDVTPGANEECLAIRICSTYEMASGRLEVSLSLADKRVSKSQLGSVLIRACSGIWRFCWANNWSCSIQMDQTPCQDIKDSLIRQGMQNIRGAFTEKDWQKREKDTNTTFWEHTQSSLDSQKEHAPLFAQQHKSTCHNGHFHRARWRIPPREYVHANGTYLHFS